MKQLIAQVSILRYFYGSNLQTGFQVKDAIQTFEVKYPNDIGVWVFDCSSAHESFSEDSLHANKMNRSPGGQQPRMHDTIIPSGPLAG